MFLTGSSSRTREIPYITPWTPPIRKKWNRLSAGTPGNGVKSGIFTFKIIKLGHFTKRQLKFSTFVQETILLCICTGWEFKSFFGNFWGKDDYFPPLFIKNTSVWSTRSFSIFRRKPIVFVFKIFWVTAFSTNPYFLRKPIKYYATLTSFTA